MEKETVFFIIIAAIVIVGQFLLFNRYQLIFWYNVKVKGRLSDWVYNIPIVIKDGETEIPDKNLKDIVVLPRYRMSENINLVYSEMFIPCFVVFEIFEKPSFYIDTKITCIVCCVFSDEITYKVEGQYLELNFENNFIIRDAFSLNKEHPLYGELKEGDRFQFEIDENGTVNIAKYFL